jgi:hypothetical protein
LPVGINATSLQRHSASMPSSTVKSSYSVRRPRLGSLTPCRNSGTGTEQNPTRAQLEDQRPLGSPVMYNRSTLTVAIKTDNTIKTAKDLEGKDLAHGFDAEGAGCHDYGPCQGNGSGNQHGICR